jgi:hypothetical protein
LIDTVILQKVDNKKASMRDARTPGYSRHRKPAPQNETRLTLGGTTSETSGFKNRKHRATGNSGAGFQSVKNEIIRRADRRRDSYSDSETESEVGGGFGEEGRGWRAGKLAIYIYKIDGINMTLGCICLAVIDLEATHRFSRK